MTTWLIISYVFVGTLAAYSTNRGYQIMEDNGDEVPGQVRMFLGLVFAFLLWPLIFATITFAVVRACWIMGKGWWDARHMRRVLGMMKADVERQHEEITNGPWVIHGAMGYYGGVQMMGVLWCSDVGLAVGYKTEAKAKEAIEAQVRHQSIVGLEVKYRPHIVQEKEEGDECSEGD